MIEEKIEYFRVPTSAGSAELAVRIWPCREQKGRVICFHEAVASGAEFVFLAEALNAAGFEVIAPDFIGHGKSTYFDNPDSYQWFEFVNCTARIVRRYSDESTHLLGASFGGMMLLIYLLAARITPRSAVFIDIPLYSTPPGDDSRCRMMKLIRADFDDLEEAKAYFAACRHALHSDARHLEPYLTEQRFHEVDGKIRVRCDRFAMDRHDEHRHNTAHPERAYSYVDELSALKSDCLFLYGADSQVRDDALVLELSDRHPRLNFGIIEGGHPPPLMSFNQIGPIVEFLARHAQEVAPTAATTSGQQSLSA